MRAWYTVQTKPRHETQAETNLQRQGFQVYLPRYRRRRSHARRVDYVRAPLFPSYLFVSFDVDADRWLAVRSTFGVQQLLSNGDQPIVVPPYVLDCIRTRQGPDGLVVLNPVDRFRAGDAVMITEGPLADLVGVFESCSDEERVTVLLKLLGRDVRLAVPAHAVERPS